VTGEKRKFRIRIPKDAKNVKVRITKNYVVVEFEIEK